MVDVGGLRYNGAHNERITMIKVACLYYEICGTATYFVDEAEYEVYGDDWACGECLDTVAEFAVGMW